MGKEIINWGVISTAKIADTNVIPGIKGAKNALLYGIASRSEDKLVPFAKKHEPVKTYLSYEALLDDPNIDAVYIPLPNGLHCKWAIAAAQKKKHILCEKPLGVTAKEIEEIKRACDENRVLFMEAFAYRHSPLTFKVKELIDACAIGNIRFIESHFAFPLKNINNVRMKPELAGGCTYDLGCYNISIITHLIGEDPLSIVATGDIGSHSFVDETSCIIMEFKDGIKAFSYSSFHAKGSRYTVVGDTGSIHVPVQFNHKGAVKIEVKNEKGIEEILLQCPDNYMLEVEQLGRCILEGEKPLVTFEDSYRNAKIIDQALCQIFKR